MKHIVSVVQPYPGRLATFDAKLFSTEPVTALLTLEQLVLVFPFHCKSDIKQNTDGRDVGMSKTSRWYNLMSQGSSKSYIRDNNKQFKYMFIVCQSLEQPLLLA